jgi:acetyl-CoA synthetase
MAWQTITKSQPPAVPPHLADYDRARAAFRWDEVPLDGLPDGGLSIVHEAVDRWAAGGRAHRQALRFVGRDGPGSADRVLTYGELAEQTYRFAAVLDGLGVAPGEVVVGLMGRLPQLYVAILGTLRHGSVFCPLFSAFGPQPVRQRLQLGGASVLVTTPSLYRKKVGPIRAEVPALRHVLLVGPGIDRVADEPGVHDLEALLRDASPSPRLAATTPETPALLHFTSGTTGTPKGAVHVHAAVRAHHATARSVLDLHDDDVFWCTADPGWVTGTSYGVIAPSPVVSPWSWTRWSSTPTGGTPSWSPRPSPSGTRHPPRCGCSSRPAPSTPSSTTCRPFGWCSASASPSTPKWWCGGSRRSGSPSTTPGGRQRPARS